MFKRQPIYLSKLLTSNSGLLAVLTIFVCTIVYTVHWPALSAKALSFDDDQYFTANVLVQNPSLASAKRFLTEVLEPSTVRGYYQPLTMISLMLDYALGGRENNLTPVHRTSLILHTANTVLMILLLYLLFENIWAAAAAGLLFGLHPMTVETIPWLGERKTLLAAFFALVCLIFYVRYTRTNGRRYYIACFGTYILALMSKPTSTPLPLVMLLMDFWPLRRISSKPKIILEKLPFFAAGALSAVITYISQSRTAATVSPGRFGFERVVLVVCHNIIFYLYKIVWPVNLSSHYAFPQPLNLSNPTVLAGVLGTALLIPLLIISLRWTHAVLTGWLIFFIAIFPTLQIIGFSNVIASDKFAYLPSVGLLMVLCWAFAWLLKKGRTLIITVTAVVLTIAAAESFGTRSYLRYWKDSVTLFERMLSLTPNAAPVHNMLGIALQSRGSIDQAAEHYRRAIELDPLYPEPCNNLAGALLAQHKFDDAIACCHKALKLRPNYASPYSNLGLAFQSKGNFDDAVNYYHRALSIEPENPEIHYNLGVTLQLQGKLDQAAEHYIDAIKIQPHLIKARSNLAVILAAKGRLDEAIDNFTEALKAQPDSAEIHNNLAYALESQGKLHQAVEYYRCALRINPDYLPALNNIANIIVTHHDPNIGNINEALTFAERAAELTKYGAADTLDTLASAYAAANQFDKAAATAQKALELALTANNTDLANRIRRQLELYKQSKTTP
jgi:tetratricopeptide (TPR) repeat protein